MSRFLLKRLLFLFIVLFGMAVLVFVATHLLPADPARVAAGPSAGADEVEKVRARLGLDQPLLVQFGLYLKQLAVFDLGQSIRSNQPVAGEIGSRLPATLELTVAALVIYVLISILLGVLAATGRSKHVDSFVRIFAVGGSSIPPYWLALLLQLVFYYLLDWLPSGGRLPLSLAPPEKITGFYLVDSVLTGNWETLRLTIIHMVLPVTSLVLGHIGLMTRLVRSRMMQEQRQDYVRTARSKGLPESRVIYRHTLKNAINPLITMIGIQTGYMVGGMVLIESIFRWPGLGSYALSAIENTDLPAVAGVALTMSLVFVLVNLAVDILYAVLDPRVRLS